MKVVAFLPEYSAKQAGILRGFAAGIPGAEAHSLSRYVDCDIAVIFGLVKHSYPATWAKREVLARHSGRRLIVIESAFLRRGEYYQIGFGGAAGHADFRNQGAPADRWRALGVNSKPWRRRPDGPVVVCGQLRRDTQVQDSDHDAWCRRVVEHYRRRGARVLFRPHPREREPGSYGVPSHLIDTRPLRDVLAEAQCFVTYNSTAGVDAAIKGVPVVACDAGSMAWPVAAHGLGAPPRFPSRRAWLAGLGYAQWTLAEMRAGLPWRHLTRP